MGLCGNLEHIFIEVSRCSDMRTPLLLSEESDKFTTLTRDEEAGENHGACRDRGTPQAQKSDRFYEELYSGMSKVRAFALLRQNWVTYHP